MKNTITETTRLLLQGNLTKEEADKILLDLHIVSNSGLNKCIELFDALTDQERTIVMDKHCKGCGNKITNWICDKCH